MKKTTIILIAIGLLLAIGALPGYAADAKTPSVSIAGKTYTKAAKGDGWDWDGEQTLHLSTLSMTDSNGITLNGDDMVVSIENTNTITASGNAISGTGNLTVTGVPGSTLTLYSDTGCPLYAAGGLDINYIALNAIKTGVKCKKTVMAAIQSDNDISISNASVSATMTGADQDYGFVAGILANDIQISKSFVHAKSASAVSTNIAIMALNIDEAEDDATILLDKCMVTMPVGSAVQYFSTQSGSTALTGYAVCSGGKALSNLKDDAFDTNVTINSSTNTLTYLMLGLVILVVVVFIIFIWRQHKESQQ